MDRATTTHSPALPRTAVLVLCAAILFAGYISATLRPVTGTAAAVEASAVER